MLHGLLVTHGTLGQALVETAFLIVGPHEGIDAISNRDLSRESLVKALLDRLESLSTADGMLILVDTPGGAPHVAARLALSRLSDDRRVQMLGPVTGVNLPMLLTFLNRRETTPVEELVEIVLDRGRGGIQ